MSPSMRSVSSSPARSRAPAFCRPIVPGFLCKPIISVGMASCIWFVNARSLQQTSLSRGYEAISPSLQALSQLYKFFLGPAKHPFLMTRNHIQTTSRFLCSFTQGGQFFPLIEQCLFPPPPRFFKPLWNAFFEGSVTGSEFETGGYRRCSSFSPHDISLSHLVLPLKSFPKIQHPAFGFLSKWPSHSQPH